MFPRPTSGLSIIKILTGINKSLSIAKEILPIYESVKPAIQNSGKIVSSLKSGNLFKINNTKNNISTKNESQRKNTTNSSISNYNVNSPSFFQ